MTTPASGYRRPTPARAWGLAGAVVTLAGFALCLATFPEGATSIGSQQARLSVFDVRPAASAKPAPPATTPAKQKPRPSNRDPQAGKPSPQPASVAENTESANPIAIAPNVIAPAHRITPQPTTAPIAPPKPALPKRGDEVRDAYAAMLWQRIAARRPEGLHLPGTAVVLFTLDGTGRLTAIDVRQSSGSALLDRIALRTVHRAAPFPAPPDGIDDPTFSISFHFD